MKKSVLLFALSLATSVSVAQQNPVERDSTKTQTLDEVLVRSVRVKPNAPITHSNVTKTQLEPRNLGQDLPILLNFLPSVVTTSDAGAGIGYTGIRIRGVSPLSTNITINGIPYTDAESLGTFWVNLPDFSSSVESLQLQRGVGTSTNGSGAFGASINILTDATSENPSAELSNSFGSYNTQRHTVKFSTGKINDAFELAGRLSKINSDGYVDRAFSDLKSYFLQGTYTNNGTLIKALAFGGHEKTYQSWDGLTQEQLEENRRQNPLTYENEIDNYNQDHYQLHWNQKIDQNWSTNLGLNYTKGRGYFEQYRADDDASTYDGIVEATGVDSFGTAVTDLIRRRWLDNDYYVVNAAVNYEAAALDLILGGSYSTYDGDHYGEIIWARQFSENASIRDQYYFGNGRKTDFSVFAKATYTLTSKIDVFGDLQFRNVGYKTTGLTSDLVHMLIDETYGFFNPKLGVTFQFAPNSNVYASYARANREPSRSDFESNPNIKSEQLNDFEIGWRYNNKSLMINVNSYYMHYNEQLILTGALDDVGAPIRKNSGDSYRLGLEIEAAYAFSNKFKVQPNITFSSNKNKQTFSQIDGVIKDLGETNISFSPEIVASNMFIYSPLKDLSLNFLTKFVGEQYMGNTDTQTSKLESYAVSDFNVSYQWSPKSIVSSVVVSALINNIFNEKYVSNGYYYTFDDSWSVPGEVTTIEGAGYYPQATRNFLVGITLKF
ncbi:MAG: TonB-dependent receptor [Flavobacteriaceae bacterium]|jgi:iron complex outermembrane receptor protein|nr:TonB-dependent receptor [Flavobacteriaceae bacterium]MDG1384878.1 TonB-dependent receptor [Flavobacteriaceae bacterium]